MNFNINELFSLSIVLVSIGTFINSLEILSILDHYSLGGLNDWRIIKTCRKWTTVGSFASILTTLFSKPGWIVLNVSRLIFSVLIICFSFKYNFDHPVIRVLLSLMVIATCLFHMRNPIGLDGSDQMSLIVLVSLMIMTFFPTNRIIILTSICFIAFQSILSYISAGIAKLFYSGWRDGTALIGIVRTENYGWSKIFDILKHNRKASFMLSWILLIFESFFFVSIFDYRLALLFMSAGLIFHFLNAYIMGLNNFFWAFVATYPAVFYCAINFKI